ncbi:hypothetical protein DSO57_1037270 [Entomophthora muscae]|uniref:Uncharacterized protein n=1 Tax=Entomophthora muscae TaxID=34485 RepID=A0ACC2SC26_9FUNG|nr:hypothetical protein DSO57_1037270 [Entomophthora muscae]
MLLFLPLILSIAAAPACSDYVCVEILEQKDVFQFTLTGKANTQYMAVGIGTRMDRADMFIAWFDKNKKPQVSHRTAKGHALSQELKLALKITQSDVKNTSITFAIPQSSSKLDTTQVNELIWAHYDRKSSITRNIPMHTQKGTLRYSFQGEVEQDSGVSAFIVWHGILMILAWMILPAMAIFIARYLKDSLGPRWLTAHMTLFAAAAAAAVLSITIVAYNLGNVLDDPHAAIGVVVMVLMGVQIILGVVIDKLWDPERNYIPMQDIVHWWLGRLLFLMAISNIIYGIVLVGNPIYFWFPTTCFMIIITLSFIYGHIKIGRVAH